jgi:alpha-tubulin suppressor-like RCC1 family protein
LFGWNFWGQVGDGTTTLWRPSPTEVTALGAEVSEVSAGDLHTCARNNDGSVWCWGLNEQGQLGDGTTGDPDCMSGCRLEPTPVKLACP